MKGYEVISALNGLIRETDIVVSSNGNISRETFHLIRRPQVYLRGSMGLPIAVGMGMAQADPTRQVIALTGDGNFLMGLGSVATAAHYRPKNLKILVLDNAVYFTTGGQRTVSTAIDFRRFFRALGIEPAASKVATPEHITEDLSALLGAQSMAALHLVIEKGKKSLTNIPWHPEEITKRLQDRLTR